MSFPAFLVEADDGSPQSFLYDRIGGRADAELGCGISEEGGILRHRNLFGAVVLEVIVFDVAWVPLREDTRKIPEEVEKVLGVRGVGG